MKIIYLIAGTYRPAGMERVLAQKTNWLAEHGHEVVIVTTDQKDRPSAFELHHSIRCIDLAIGYEDNNGSSFFDKLIHFPIKQLTHRRKLAKLLKAEKADIVISMFCNDASFLPGIKDGSRKVLEIHFSRFKRLQYNRKGLYGLADRYLSWKDRRSAARFDRFVVLTKEDAGYWGDMPNMTVIPNGRTFTFDNPSDCRSHQIIAVGRYSYQKGFDMLLETWRKMDTHGWILRIAGCGEELGQVPGNVLLGLSTDMKKEYLDSSILVLPSRYEGLPMVLLEAQAAGLPIVAFECKCGPRDVITDGVDGFLVPEGDTDTMAERLFELMDDEDLRRRMGSAAYRASDRFDAESIMLRWQQLFEQLCAR